MEELNFIQFKNGKRTGKAYWVDRFFHLFSSLKKMSTVKELRVLARSVGINGYYRMKKSELIRALKLPVKFLMKDDGDVSESSSSRKKEKKAQRKKEQKSRREGEKIKEDEQRAKEEAFKNRRKPKDCKKTEFDYPGSNGDFMCLELDLRKVEYIIGPYMFYQYRLGNRNIYLFGETHASLFAHESRFPHEKIQKL